MTSKKRGSSDFVWFLMFGVLAVYLYSLAGK